MVSLLLKTLMFVLAISYVCSAVIPQSLSTKLPENTIDSSEDQTVLTSPVRVGTMCPNTGDESINRAKKSCIAECQNYKNTPIYNTCIKACSQN